MLRICNVNDDELYWSNEDGWVDINSSDIFTDEERNKVNLPMEGRWRIVTTSEPINHDNTDQQFIAKHYVDDAIAAVPVSVKQEGRSIGIYFHGETAIGIEVDDDGRPVAYIYDDQNSEEVGQKITFNHCQ